jgi:chromosome segregation ATPase
MLLPNMKNRIGIIVLVLVFVCVGLGIVLTAVKRRAGDEQRDYAERNTALSNNLVQANDQLERQKQVTADLYTEREKHLKELDVLTNKYVQSLTAFTQVSNNLVKTELALKDSQMETAKRDVKIAELQSQNQTLDKRSTDLSAAITNLTEQITATQQKLATSEGEKDFLEKELKRMMAEKAELERQFNDITVVRAQVSKLKHEMSVARRLEWIRQGLFASTDQRGAQKLMPAVPMVQTKETKPAYDLNVEVNADGSVRVIPPLTGATNSPPK